MEPHLFPTVLKFEFLGEISQPAEFKQDKILNTSKTTKQIFEECEPKERHDKFLELFQIVAQKWMNEELDLSKPGFEGFSVFRSRIANVLKGIQGSLTDKSNIMVVTSGGAISGVYAEVISCSHEDIQKLNFGIKNMLFNNCDMHLIDPICGVFGCTELDAAKFCASLLINEYPIKLFNQSLNYLALANDISKNQFKSLAIAAVVISLLLMIKSMIQKTSMKIRQLCIMKL